MDSDNLVKTPTSVGYLVRDLMFGSKIKSLISEQGFLPVNIQNSNNESDLVLIALNLELGAADWDKVINLREKLGIQIYGYFPHVRAELEGQAKEHDIISSPRGAFLGMLSRVLDQIKR